MFKGIPLTEIGKRPLIASPKPKPAYDANGPVLKDGRPAFIVKAENVDYGLGKSSPVKQAFYDHFLIDKDRRATMPQLAVFHALARTTEWSEVAIVIDGANAPILQSNEEGQAVILKHGNRSATRTIQQLSDEIRGSYDSVRKALKFWEDLSIIRPIGTYEKEAVKERHRQAGRPIDFRRYEFDPEYVWNGFIWIGVAYSLLHFSVTN